MAALEKLYQIVMSDRQVMGEFVKASGTDRLAAFAEKYGCTATDSEIRRYFTAKCEGEIPDDELDIAAGGTVDFTMLLSKLYERFCV